MGSQNAESKNDESGDNRGDAVIFVFRRLLPLAGNIDETEQRRDRRRQQGTDHGLKDPGDSAEKAGEAKSADSSSPSTSPSVALPPASLYADEKADRKRHPEALKYFDMLHRITICQLRKRTIQKA
jgi:hypothetical protein